MLLLYKLLLLLLLLLLPRLLLTLLLLKPLLLLLQKPQLTLLLLLNWHHRLSRSLLVWTRVQPLRANLEMTFSTLLILLPTQLGQSVTL
jgi:hypothetical protein